jgi:hypothetical protein
MNYKTAFCLLTMMFAIACGGGSGDDDDATPSEIVTDQLDLFCERAFECMADYPTDAPVAFDDFFQTDVASCQANFDTISLADEIQASVDAGRIDFDAGDGASCNAFFDGESCVDFWGTFFDDSPPSPASCDSTFLGNVADGAACTIDLDCENTDSVCDDTAKTCGPA